MNNTTTIEKNTAVSIYYCMLRIRLVEEAIADHYPEQEMRCPVHLCIGQEAIAAGICANLNKDDYVLSNHRSHGHYLAKGGDLNLMMAEIYSKVTGCSSGKGGSMHLVDLSSGFLGSTPIVGNIIPVAVGTAFSTKLKGEKRVTVVFLGDAASEEGVFYESLNFASLKKLPVVFVCENNFFSVYSPLNVRQPENRNNLLLAEALGILSSKGDGNNPDEVYNLGEKAIAHARNGLGPYFLEFDTYRWREHCGPYYDNNIGYRTEAEFLEWQKKCPLCIYENNLLENGIIEKQQIDEFKDKIKQEIKEAFNFAKKSPFPPHENLLKDVYSNGAENVKTN